MSPLELFNQGQLEEAINAARDFLRGNPRDLQTRGLLAVLHCFDADLERADKQLDTILSLDPEYAVGVNILRQLVRGEQARQDFFKHGHIPEFLETPSEEVTLRLKASISFREGDLKRARQELDEANQTAPLKVTWEGKTVEPFRDLDDLLATVFEICTLNGKYLWVPMGLVERLEFKARSSLADNFWAPLTLTLRNGKDLQGYMPVLYPGTAQSRDPQIRLGRATEWQGEDDTPIRGVGQRMFLIGDDAIPMYAVNSLNFNS